MKGDPKVITILRQAVSAETQSEAQWCQDAAWLARIGLHGLSDYILTEAAEEHGHRQRYFERLVQLDAEFVVSAEPTASYSTVEELLKNQYRLESGAVAMYTEGARTALAVGDFVTYDIFRRTLEDEQKHLEWIEGQQYLISQIGLPNYLQGYIKLPEAR